MARIVTQFGRRECRLPDPARNRVDEKIQEKVGDLHRREHDSSVLATQ